jgi:hypothetical protein
MAEQRTGTPIEPGLLAYVSGQVKQWVAGWFPPGAPMPPVTPPGTEGPRRYDYPVAVNTTQGAPKAGARVTFQMLRTLADSYDLMRIGIETRKDTFSTRPWQIKVLPKPGEGPRKLKERQAADPNVTKLTELFRRPDGINTFRDWSRMLLEDMLVVDAASIYVRPTLGGNVFGFYAIDGTTIKVVIDELGFTPQPPLPAYQQYLKGLPAFDLTTKELVYRPRNVRTGTIWGFSPVEQVITTVNLALRRQMHQLQYYTQGNIPDAIVSAPKEWTAKQIKEFEQDWNAMLEGNTGQRRKIRWVPSGENGKAEITFTKELQLKDDMDEWLARVICWALSLPPTALVKQMNRAASENAEEQGKDEGLLPTQHWFADTMNLLIQSPDYLNLPGYEFAFMDEVESNPASQAEIDERLVKCGIKGIDECREERGLEPIGVDNVVITMSGAVPLNAETIDMALEQAKTGLEASKKALTDPPPDPGGPGGGKGKSGAEKAALTKKKRLTAKAGTSTPLMKQLLPKVAGSIHALFKHTASKAAAALGHAYTLHAKAAGDEADDILSALNLDDWVKLVDEVVDPLTGVAKEGGANALAELDLDEEGMFDLVNGAAVEYAQERAAQLVGMKYNAAGDLIQNPSAKWSITESTRDMLRGEVVRALTDGLTVDELQQSIMDAFAFSEARAETIARTELAAAHVAGNLAGWEASGVVTGKEWILGSEHDFEDECNDNEDAGVVDLGDTFPSGDDGPPAHPNCICDVVAVLADEAEAAEE